LCRRDFFEHLQVINRVDHQPHERRPLRTPLHRQRIHARVRLARQERHSHIGHRQRADSAEQIAVLDHWPRRLPSGSVAGPRDYPAPHTEATQVVTDLPRARETFATREGLEPNTKYEVEGRGTFYTNGEGRVHYVEAEYGGTGNLNRELMKPAPDTTYVVDKDHVFVTDAESRTILAHVDRLSLGDADRSQSVQSRVGHEGGEGYEGGHALGRFQGGGGEYVNMIAMLREVNRGGGNSYFNLENSWRALLRKDPLARIEVDFEPVYVGDSLVPDRIGVTYSINEGREIFVEYGNVKPAG
jgi:hypothetical protein